MVCLKLHTYMMDKTCVHGPHINMFKVDTHESGAAS